MNGSIQPCTERHALHAFCNFPNSHGLSGSFCGSSAASHYRQHRKLQLNGECSRRKAFALTDCALPAPGGRRRIGPCTADAHAMQDAPPVTVTDEATGTVDSAMT
jgi:hypothetical protein